MKIWSQLAESTKKKYRKDGVSPQRYNAWTKTSTKTKSKLSAKGITRDEFLKAPTTATVKRSAAQRIAYDRLTTLLPRANKKTVAQGVKAMTGGQLHIAATANVDTIRRLASHPGNIEVNGKVINPFWYR